MHHISKCLQKYGQNLGRNLKHGAMLCLIACGVLTIASLVQVYIFRILGLFL